MNEVANLSIGDVRALETLIEKSRNSLAEYQQLVEFSEQMAENLGEAGKQDSAESYRRQADAARKTLAENMYFIGQCRTHFGDNHTSMTAFKAAIGIAPQFVNAHIALGRGFLETGKYDEALSALNEAKQLGSENPRLYYYLGETYRELRRMDEAEACYRAVIDGFPTRRADGSQSRLVDGVSWELFAGRAITGLQDIFRWRRAVEEVGLAERDAERLKKIAKNRPIYITAIEGRGWVLSHMVSEIEPFLRQLWLDGIRDPFVIVLNADRFCNPPLVKMYGRTVWMVDDRYPRLRRRLVAARELLKAEGSPIAVNIDRFNPRPHAFNQYVNHLKGWLEAPQVLSFSDEEEANGRAVRAKVGLPENAEYVCFGVRETSYYSDAWTGKMEPKYYWEANLHDIEETVSMGEEMGAETHSVQASVVHQRLNALRTPLENYLPAVNHLAGKGLYALRMGLNVDQELPGDLDPKVIDYASRYRSDFGDIYLFANSKFVIAGGTGIIWINAAFGKPFIVTDLYLPNNICFNTARNGMPNLFLPRKYWVKDEKRFLTFAESFKVCRFYQIGENCQRDGIENVPNTAEEIFDAVDELDQRIDGTWQGAPEDEELQDRFMGLLQPHDEGYGLNGRIGANFLRCHVDLL